MEQDSPSYEEVASSKRAALKYVTEAFAEAELDGLDGDCMVQAALFAAFQYLVEVYGEEQTAVYAETMPARIRGGGFSTCPKH